jgi:hypothetical protein
MKADLLAGFGSFKFLPMPIVISTNNANPKLILFDNHIEYRGGFTTNELKYTDIDKIDVYFYRESTNNIVISKKTGLSTFIGNFTTRQQLIEFLKVFKEKGCELTNKAESELKKSLDIA